MSENPEIVLSVEMGDSTSAATAEAYAIGKRNGVDVTEGDPAYQNNAKYYSEQAGADISEAVEARDAAIEAKEGAEAARDEAETAQSGAETAAQSAGTAKDAAVAAQGNAETAKDAAAAARTGAENAAQNAGSARDAAIAAKTAAESARSGAESAQAKAEAAAQGAEAKVQEIQDMTVAAQASSTPSATISKVGDHLHILFGLVKGDKGDPGEESVLTPELISGTDYRLNMERS